MPNCYFKQQPASQVKQISPDKNVNCHCTTLPFTVSREPVGFVFWCILTPETRPYMTFLFIGSQLCTRASFPQVFTNLQLPSASRYNRQHMLYAKQCRFSDRGLAPHKFTPMLGVHQRINLTQKSSAPFVAPLFWSSYTCRYILWCS